MFDFFRKRLHVQIYLTIIFSLFMIVVAVGLLFTVIDRENADERVFDIATRLTWRALPPPSAPAAQQEAVLRDIIGVSDLSASLFDENRALIARLGKFIPPPLPDAKTDGWHSHRGKRGFGPVWITQLPDKRWFAVDMRVGSRANPFIGIPLLLGAIALAIGIASYPLVRRLTGRLERLQLAVDAVGDGDLTTRVAVEGVDEVASLATSFNQATQTIERLINSNRQLLANASHELRTPLARVRLGVEMLKNKPDEKRQAALEADIGELDELIDEILLMSRLEAGGELTRRENVDLLALAHEECARYNTAESVCDVKGDTVQVWGDASLLRRAIRNLLDNAHKHGRAPVTLTIEDGPIVKIIVEDSGNGIPEAQLSKIFEPFHRAPGKQNVDGYGLGLALVRQIAEAHGGHVDAKNAAQGAVFIFQISK